MLVPTVPEIARRNVFEEEAELVMLEDGVVRYYGPWIHVDIINIIDGRFRMQQGGTEDGVAGELVAASIPKDWIALAFKHPSSCAQSEFAVA